MHPLLSCLLLFLLPLFALAQAGESPGLSVIPRPANVVSAEGGAFVLDGDTRLVAPLDSQRQAVGQFVKAVPALGGLTEKWLTTPPEQNYLLLKKDPALPAEHYRLEADERHLRIAASSYAGWIYGLQTLRQLLPPGVEGSDALQKGFSVPAMTITDGPRFGWRGLMLDVSRHFFPKDYILATIDRMAMLKLNVLHLHLVDDQGWRIEIKRYPRLTGVGAWRVDQEDRHWDAREANDPNEEGTYGGFYTQDDIREIVAYADKNAIRVIPEIEMPAHVMSALAAYPEYSCLEQPVAVPSGGVWPITDIYCPGKEATFEFLENIMEEVMALFPDDYIHVGGDEATHTNWETCPDCQRRMHEEGLANTHELQSYFIQRMERFLRKHGKTLIGWDEILEGGLADGATVMSWRGTAGGLKASGAGHDVVMTPGDYVYLNQYQGNPDYEPLAFGGFVPLKKVYGFDPQEGVDDETQARHILGAQANLWSEFITTTSRSEYMLFPRLAALSEVMWTPLSQKDWTDFSRRTPDFLARLDQLGINYARSAYAVSTTSMVDRERGGIELALETEFPEVDIRYTLNGSPVTAASPRYTGPLYLDTTTSVRAATFSDTVQLGATLTETFVFHQAVSKPVTYQPLYSKQYPGQGPNTLVDVFRGSKNFHDGRWQAWLNDNVVIDLDMQDTISLSSVSVGAMENEGSGIYFPVEIEVSVSTNGRHYDRAGLLARPYAANGEPQLEEFSIRLPPLSARYIRVRVKNLGQAPRGGGSWMFLDEITVQ